MCGYRMLSFWPLSEDVEGMGDLVFESLFSKCPSMRVLIFVLNQLQHVDRRAGIKGNCLLRRILRILGTGICDVYLAHTCKTILYLIYLRN
jgi:hypothetical protein